MFKSTGLQMSTQWETRQEIYRQSKVLQVEPNSGASPFFGRNLGSIHVSVPFILTRHKFLVVYKTFVGAVHNFSPHPCKPWWMVCSMVAMKGCHFYRTWKMKKNNYWYHGPQQWWLIKKHWQLMDSNNQTLEMVNIGDTVIFHGRSNHVSGNRKTINFSDGSRWRKDIPNDRVSWCVARLPDEFRWIFGAYISRLMGKRKPISICLGVSNSCFYIFPTISRMMTTPSDLFGFFFHDLTVTSPEIWLV
jgi:hypothetical protein